MRRILESIFIIVFITAILLFVLNLLQPKTTLDITEKNITSRNTSSVNKRKNSSKNMYQPHHFSVADFMNSRPVDVSKVKTLQKTSFITNDYIFSFYDENDMNLFISRLNAEKGKVVGVISSLCTVRVKLEAGKLIDDILAGVSVTPVESGNNVWLRIPEPKESKVTSAEVYSAFGRDAPTWLGVPINNGKIGENVIIAVIDTGTKDDNVWEQIDLYKSDDNNDVAYTITNNHGSSVLKVITGDAKEQIIGTAPASKILSIRALNNNGVGDAFTIAQGIVTAVDNGAKVINMSFGGADDSFIMRKAVEYAAQKGVVLVAAVGNDGSKEVSYPAAYDDVIAVSGIDASARHLHFANYGSEVDISAPATAIATVDLTGNLTFSSGTSIATPFVSAAAAAILSLNPALSPTEIKEIICDNADDWGAIGKDELYGAGILDIERIFLRDKKGIFDIAVGPPTLQKVEDDNFVLILYVQNRGTEKIPRAQLIVEIDGVKSTVPLYDIPVSESVGKTWEFKKERFIGGASVKISYSAEINGFDDARPYNNGPIVADIHLPSSEL